MKIQVWATLENGEGRVQDLGVYESLEEIQLFTNTFGQNILITFEYVTDNGDTTN